MQMHFFVALLGICLLNGFHWSSSTWATSPAPQNLTLKQAIEATLRHHPEVKAQAELVMAADSLRGQLWERFVPALQGTVARQSLNHDANYPLPPHVGANATLQAGARAIFNFSPTTWIQYKTQSVQAQQSRENQRIVLNQLALRTVEFYSAVEVAREQLNFLQTLLLPIVDRLSTCSEVTSQEKYRDSIATLLANFRTQEVSLQYQLQLAETQLSLFTGIQTLGTLDDTHTLLTSMPFFPTREKALEIALQTSPQLAAARFAETLQDLNLTGVFWSPLQIQVGLGPTWNQYNTSLGSLAQMKHQTQGQQIGVGVTLDIPRIRRERNSTAHQQLAAQQRIEASQLQINLELQRSYLNYTRRHQNLCRLLPEKKRLKEQSARVLEQLNQDLPIDIPLAIAVIPQTWGLIRNLYEDKLYLLSEMASSRLQIGDLATPQTWTPEQFPSTLCAE